MSHFIKYDTAEHSLIGKPFQLIVGALFNWFFGFSAHFCLDKRHDCADNSVKSRLLSDNQIITDKSRRIANGKEEQGRILLRFRDQRHLL